MVLKSLLQHHSSNASILLCSGFFIMQLSHAYMTTGNTIAFTIWIFVSKVMFLCLNTLLDVLQLYFQGASVFLFHGAVTIYSDFGVQENKVCHCFHCFPIYLPQTTFVRKIRSLLFNILSRLVIAFLPKSKCLLQLQSPSAVILEPRKIKSDTVSTSICHEVMGLDAMILVF